MTETQAFVEISSRSAAALAEQYLALWNEPDADRRRRTIAELWTQDGRHVLQPPQDQHGMEHDHLQPAVNRIRDAITLVKRRQPRLCHDRAIETGDGIVPRGAAKQAQYHRVSSAARGRVQGPAGKVYLRRVRRW